MQVKQVKIGIRSVDEAFENFIATAEAIERGEVVKKNQRGYISLILMHPRLLWRRRQLSPPPPLDSRPIDNYFFARCEHT